MTLNGQKQYARRIQQLPIQTMMPRRQALRFQRRKKGKMSSDTSMESLFKTTPLNDFGAESVMNINAWQNGSEYSSPVPNNILNRNRNRKPMKPRKQNIAID
ncbi:hypothetical protein EVAR_52132_1 [Eumeta japonica]|uniref:Uncharacterized protein n=1 Tax=Eumeta variegata TaxID=151549 RepID=A0A4C1XPD8_EUMVA|nr:hypothetical protein EVAR_52132_1 [Eumeta japonica]